MRRVNRIAVASACLVASGAYAQTIAPIDVEETSLYRDAFSTGILSAAEGALPSDLWQGSNVRDVDFLLSEIDAQPRSPSMGAALRRVLLSSGAGPAGLSPAAGGRKLLALAEAGMIDEARTVASLSSAPGNDPWVGQALAVADLLENDLSAACQRNQALTSGRDAPFWVKLRIICYANAKEFDAAELTLRIVREQGLLSETEDTLLTAVSIPAPAKAPIAPMSALELAAMRAVAAPLDMGNLDTVSAGVLRSIATDQALEPRVRLAGAAGAAASGVMSANELRSLYGAIPFDTSAFASVRGAIADRPADLVTDALVYQSVQQMAAPEFIRDRAERIATALDIANSFPRAYVVALLYDEAVRGLEGAIVTPDQAGNFALMRMALGDSRRATNWLLAMLGGGVSTLTEEQALRFIELTNLLAILDPASGGAVAAAANVEVGAPRPPLAIASGGDADRARFAEIVAAAFEATANKSEGQAALAALAVSGLAYSGDPIANVVLDASLAAAGLGDLSRRRAFEAAWAATFSDPVAAAPTPATTPVTTAPQTTADDGLTPRLKPKAQ